MAKQARNSPWYKAQLRVISFLRHRGFKDVSLAENWTDPFDIVCEGKRVEVKHAKWRRVGARFNIHRHGKLDESQVDAYIFVITGLPYHKAHVYVVFKAPLRTPTIVISFRSMLNQYIRNVNNTDLLR